MPIITFNDRRTLKGRILVFLIYALLSLGGLVMVYPFLVMVTGSVSTAFDYERRAAIPRFLWSEEDRFMRVLCSHFPPLYRSSFPQLRSYFDDWPAEWGTWAQLTHREQRGRTDAWARRQLDELKDPVRRGQLLAAARDYAAFTRDWNLRETVLAFQPVHAARFLEERYGSVAKLNQAWECAVDAFHEAPTAEWSGEPFDQASYIPDRRETRYQDLLAFREAFRENRYTPRLRGITAGQLRPASLRHTWLAFAEAAAPPAGTPPREGAQVAPQAARLPFPVPADAEPSLVTTWRLFLKERFPLRHIEIPVSAERTLAFQSFLRERFRRLDYFNTLMRARVRDWSEITLSATMPEPPLSTVWIDFLRQKAPVEEWRIRDTLPDRAFQDFAWRKYGSLEKINAAYGLRLECLQQLPIPYRAAFLTTFAGHGWKLNALLAAEPYSAVLSSIGRQPRIWFNTLTLVVLSMLLTLTVNPLAGYALSRFQLRHGEKLIVFCLGTMAFPVAVSAIPGFLLLRDMGLLNTFAALVLPTAANGMTIFILKGFFDSLPREMYEAATIDGAPEWLIFLKVALPLMKPILAVSLLGAFLSAYNTWEWAIIVCQDKRMWTVAVWTMQFAGKGVYSMAVFVLTSIPVLVVFLMCQKVILRGIILPQMK